MKNTLTILIALLFVPPAALHAADVPTHPNILFIMVDEMKWNVMGCAGHEIVKTPHLDQLAREGTRFATAYTVAAICVPSRYSAFTSRYAHVHGSTDPAKWTEILSPDLDCTVRNVTITGVRARDSQTELPMERVVRVIEQKLNPDYPKTTPRGGTGKGLWIR